MSLSQHPVQPRSSAGTMPLTPFVLLAAAWGAVALAWLAWAAGALTSAMTNRPGGPAFGAAFVDGLLHGQWAVLYPHVNHTAVAVVYGALVAAAAAPVTAGWVIWERRRTHAGDPLPSMARPREVADLTPAGVTKRALQLRPSLGDTPVKKLAGADLGVALGTMVLPGRRGPTLRASWEDGVLAVMGPRAGKTTSLAVPLILDAPGAVVATSNRADVWATTRAARARVGRNWVFDPQGITRTGQGWWWNPLSSISSVEDASRMASHFVQPIKRDKGEDFWLLAAEDLLTSFFLAAAARGVGMSDVQAWLADAGDDEPVGLLFEGGFPEVARALRGRQNGAPETRDGIYETARTAAKCLQDPRIMAWVNQPGTETGLDQFNPDLFPLSRDTLYLLSKDGAGSSGPLVAALTDQVMRHGVRRAEARGGRLDPPMLCMLDEAANICPLADLPQLYSHYGGRGIILVTILQTYQQGTTVWGDRGMGTLWGAATVKLIGAGADDPRFAADVSALVGEHDVATLSMTRDGSGTMSRQISVRRQRILGPEDVRALKRGHAILLASGARPAMLELSPWYRQPAAATLTAETAAAIAEISDAAEQERLISDLSAQGVKLPALASPTVIERAPQPSTGTPAGIEPAPLRESSGADGTGEADSSGGPVDSIHSTTSRMPRFRGSARRP
ncbi:Type IV secretory pathway, VirD4 component, TraG/TraD family ATPase [Asanoa hainanensis]|uniref:Type IV secretory pathway, VirD4 component, TraG/TraD family ATPase n=1 Tax=Asanoa hainanensis TaxID=560556 RepID=A0A239PFB5_9ACTN|nr:type IV secretory system conjugative DNA transfer family protein [Asanoa hainanensis]SNT65693.1 Type IV secretory pathway, VirD4 component, TraG/TraD family ATPase [Asanoa hainanensis]